MHWECLRRAATPPLRVFLMMPFLCRDRWLPPSRPPRPRHSGGREILGVNRALTIPLVVGKRAKSFWVMLKRLISMITASECTFQSVHWLLLPFVFLVNAESCDNNAAALQFFSLRIENYAASVDVWSHKTSPKRLQSTRSSLATSQRL